MEYYAHREESQNGAFARLYENLPRRPYCGSGKRIECILPKEKAVEKRYIQINHPLLIRHIVFDLDYEGSAFSWDEQNLPPFTFTVVNRQNAHCHGIYEIDPVFMGSASEKTIRLLKHVIATYKELMNADRVITSQKLLVKNPFHPDWEVICNDRVYTLSELYEYISSIPTSRRNTGEKISPDPFSRNVTLFNRGRLYAYRIVSECKTDNELYNKVESYLKSINEKDIRKHFKLPLPYNEIRSITRSITRWVWHRRNNLRRRSTMGRKKCRAGTMGFEKIQGLPSTLHLAEVKRRQSLSGKRTSAMRRGKTLRLLTESYVNLLASYTRVTQTMVRDDTGYSLRTVKYYWHKIIEGAKRSNQDNSRNKEGSARLWHTYTGREGVSKRCLSILPEFHRYRNLGVKEVIPIKPQKEGLMAGTCFMCGRQCEELYYCPIYEYTLCFECLQYFMCVTECEEFCSYCLYSLVCDM